MIELDWNGCEDGYGYIPISGIQTDAQWTPRYQILLKGRFAVITGSVLPVGNGSNYFL